MIIKQITEHERYLMRHALGLDQAKKSYRNRFAAAPFAKTAGEWERLVDIGLAERMEAVDTSYWWYRVTDAGKEACR